MGRENVLLLCLSKVQSGRGLTNYIYKDDATDESIEVNGFMTNEAPAKVALSMVVLNRVVVICSEEVKNLRPSREGEDEVNPQQTHFEYYEQEISKFAVQKNKPIPEFKPVNIKNDPGEHEIARAAVEASEQIMGEMDEGKDVHVYIDYNGGLRYVASMLLNIANLMEQRGAVVENIFTMNFENKDNEGRVPVENFKGILQSSRLVSGIKEYVDYGRCGELKKYFKDCGDRNIKNIINQMDILSHNFNLCDTNRIFAEKKEGIKNPPKGSIETVKGLLENYIQNNRNLNEGENKDPFGILFRYVAEDILDGYSKLFQDDLLDMLDWCLEKDYIQQAVTFYVERMPIYFWEKRIYYPTDAEENEYKQIEYACELYQELDRDNPYKKSNNKESDAWMIMNLQDLSKGLIQMTPKQLGYLKKNYINYNWKAAWIGKYLIYSRNEDLDWMSGNLRKRRVQLDCSEEKDNPITKGRAKTDFKTGKELDEIFSDYTRIKEQRNKINHAEESDLSTRWRYDTLTNNIKEYVDKIRNYIAGGAK